MLQKHQSRPLWARELKRMAAGKLSAGEVSRPLWARELKHSDDFCCKNIGVVAPPVGA